MNKKPSTASATRRAAGFALITCAVYAAALLILSRIEALDDPSMVTAGLTLDLVVLVPTLYYFLLVRGGSAPAASLLPFLLASFAVASVVIPPRHQAALRLLSGALPLAELGVALWIALQVKRLISKERSLGDPDIPAKIRKILQKVIGHPIVAEALTYELSLAYYAFRPPRRGRLATDEYSHHRDSGYGVMLGALLMVAGAELFGVHLLLSRWSGTAALLHVLVSLYGIAWLLGDYRALRALPHRVTDETLLLRTGLRWRLEVEWTDLRSVRRAYGPRPDELDGYRALVPLGSIDYLLELREEHDAKGPYGLTRAVRRVGIQIDDKQAFEARLQDLGVPVATG